MSDVHEKEEVEEETFLDLSDEEILNMAPPKEEPTPEPEAKAEEERGSEEKKEEEEQPEPELEAEQKEEEDEGEEEEKTSPLGASDDDAGDPPPAEEEPKREKLTLEKPEADKEKEAKPDDKEAEVAIDYEAEYKKIMAPFKANGKMMSLNKAEEAVSLMSMGANYNLKMQAIKPHLKVIKMLDNNNLLDESKISYVIDLVKHNPDAITKLLKDSGIDPLNVDVEEDSKYKTTAAYTVTDKEVELDSVLDDIQHTESYQETIDIISNKWDEPSKRIIIDNPNVITSINEQVGSGVYSQIKDVMERERVLGNLKGLSDIEAYQQVGIYMQENHLFKEDEQSPPPPQKNADTPPAKKDKPIDPELKKNKLAAGGTKNAPSKAPKKEYDILNMSDEEIEKLSANDFN